MINKVAFCILKYIDIFMDICTVINDTLVWDINMNRGNTECLDIAPDTLYELLCMKEQIA